jgi:hypothetical protein
MKSGILACLALAIVAVLGLSIVPRLAARAESESAVKASVNMVVAKDPDAVVAELFTSQGCSSCPPAQAFLGDLSRRTDVVALELHIDYWDDLKTVFSGSWKDPWSSPQWSERQQQYNRLILNSERVYTPQMVIDGKLQEEGARRSEINALIEQAKTLRRQQCKLRPQVTRDGQAKVTVEGPGVKKAARVILARIEKQAADDVAGGENKGEHLQSHNIVRDMVSLGEWDGGKQDYGLKVTPFKDGESCAVLLQDPETMHILAGTLCGL